MYNAINLFLYTAALIAADNIIFADMQLFRAACNLKFAGMRLFRAACYLNFCGI